MEEETPLWSSGSNPTGDNIFFCNTDATDRPSFFLHDGTPLKPSHVAECCARPWSGLLTPRFGLATDAATARVDDVTIQRLGRWTSAAFNDYVRAQRPGTE